MSAWLSSKGKRLVNWWNVSRLGVALLLLATLVAIGGYMNQHMQIYVESGGAAVEWFVDTPLIADFYADLSTELLGIAFTILIIDGLYRRHEKEQLKAQLIRELGGKDHGVALRAAGELKAHGWHEDGSLRGVYLQQANLSKANLYKADLSNAFANWADLRNANLSGGANLSGAFFNWADLSMADLTGARLYGVGLHKASLSGARLNWSNLTNANVTTEQLVTALSLRAAIMPNGNCYDGRFQLLGDVKDAQRKGVDIDDPEVMADFYGVSLEDYTHGQKWSREYLSSRLSSIVQDGNQITFEEEGQLAGDKGQKMKEKPEEIAITQNRDMEWAVWL